MQKYIDEIQAERQRQDAKWGGPAHDDSYSLGDWCRYIVSHAHRIMQGNSRQQLVRVAALAIAALESLDRKASEPKKRLKLDPDLADGQHSTIHDNPDGALMEAIATWMESSEPGDTFTIELVEMTDAQADALPEI